jgi:membrane-associated phospholipid phosphatase
MTDALGAWLTDFIAVRTGAIAAASIVTVCTIAVGLWWTLREHVSPRRGAAVQAAVLLVALACLAAQVARGAWPADSDAAVTAWLVDHRTAFGDLLALAVSTVFNPVEAACVTVLVAIVAVARFSRLRAGVIVLATVGGASALCFAMKLLTARGRPPAGIQVTPETDYSFPSGHVTGAVTITVMASVVVGLGRSELVQRWLSGSALAVVAAVGFSRLYLGVHWLTDVVAALLLGGAIATIGAAALRELSSARRQEPSVPTVPSPPGAHAARLY